MAKHKPGKVIEMKIFDTITKDNVAEAAKLISDRYRNPVVNMEHVRDTVTNWILNGDYSNAITFIDLQKEVREEFAEWFMPFPMIESDYETA